LHEQLAQLHVTAPLLATPSHEQDDEGSSYTHPVVAFEIDALQDPSLADNCYQVLQAGYPGDNRPLALIGIVNEHNTLSHLGLHFTNGVKLLLVVNPASPVSLADVKAKPWYQRLRTLLEGSSKIKITYNASAVAYALKTALDINLQHCVDVQLWAELASGQFGLGFAASMRTCLPELPEADSTLLNKPTYFTTESLGKWKIRFDHNDKIMRVCPLLLTAAKAFGSLEQGEQASKLGLFEAVLDDGIEHHGKVPVCFNKHRDYRLATSAMLVRLEEGAADISQLPVPSCQIDQLLAVLPAPLRAHIEKTFDKGKELREIVMDAGNPTMLYTQSGARQVYGDKLTRDDVEDSYALVGDDKFGADNRAGIEGESMDGMCARVCRCSADHDGNRMLAPDQRDARQAEPAVWHDNASWASLPWWLVDAARPAHGQRQP